MKVVILAGGFGTRISEESHLRPKPMIEIGEKPILWHIMKGYSHYGYNEFIICCGYKQHMIKEYFADYYLYNGDVTFDFGHENNMVIHNNVSEPWKVTLVDTGINTMTADYAKSERQFRVNGAAVPFPTAHQRRPLFIDFVTLAHAYSVHSFQDGKNAFCQ